MSILTELAQYSLNLKTAVPPEKAWQEAKLFFIDCLGCIIAGAQAKPTAIALEYSRKLYPAEGPATALACGGPGLNSGSAAFINGISSHFHDYDDVLPTENGHPSAVVLPAVLAVGEEIRASGAECLKAYLIGVEVIDVVSRGVNQKTHVHYGQGWHSTETMGIFGSTAAVGLLLGLNQEQMVNALSMAASESAGLQGNFGTMTKAFHAGRGAEKGILCARMAALGYGANPDIIEMVGGLALAMAGSLDAETMREKMASGQSAFIEPGLTMKPYPCCKCNHNMIDGAYNLMIEHGFTAEEVAKVTIGVQPSFFGCLKYPEAKTPLEGKFSANFNVACVLLNGRRPGIRDFQPQTFENPKLQETMAKVKMVVDHSIAGGAYANGGWDTKVKIELTDGREFNTRVLHSRGESANPLSEGEVLEKLRDDCLAISLFEDKLEKVVELLRSLEKIADINQLTAAISEAAKPFPEL